MLLGVIGAPEVLIILALILVLFGPSKLPALGTGIGKMLRGFKREMRAIEDEKAAAPAQEGGERPSASSPEPGEIDVTPAAAKPTAPPNRSGV